MKISIYLIAIGAIITAYFLIFNNNATTYPTLMSKSNIYNHATSVDLPFKALQMPIKNKETTSKPKPKRILIIKFLGQTSCAKTNYILNINNETVIANADENVFKFKNIKITVTAINKNRLLLNLYDNLNKSKPLDNILIKIGKSVKLQL